MLQNIKINLEKRKIGLYFALRLLNTLILKCMGSYVVKFKTVIREEKGWQLVRLKNPVMGGMYAVYSAEKDRIKTGLCLEAAVEVFNTVVRAEVGLR